MLSLRARIFIILSLVVLFVLGVSIFLYTRSKKQTAQTNLPNNVNVVEVGSLPAGGAVVVANIPNNVKVSPASSLDAQKNAVEQFAKIFLERFNSFSSESKYQNVRDVETMVSKSYWTQISAKIPTATGTSNSVTPFSSVITKAFGSKLSAFSDKSATVDIQAKITEEKNGIITNRDKQYKVYLIKEGQNWLVDKFEEIK